MKNKFKYTKCECGCGGTYTKWLNPPPPSNFKITERSCAEDNHILAIEREDGVKFRTGDTILLTNPTGKELRIAKLFGIDSHDGGFLQLYAYPLYTNGMYCIRNDATWMSNADDFTHFPLLQNIPQHYHRGVNPIKQLQNEKI